MDPEDQLPLEEPQESMDWGEEVLEDDSVERPLPSEPSFQNPDEVAPGRRVAPIQESQVEQNMQSLVEWNLLENSPVSRFFDTFAENASDPFTAAKRQARNFINKVGGALETGRLENASETLGLGLRAIQQSQTDALVGSLDQYRQRAEQSSRGAQPLSGYLGRATDLDYYNLLAGPSAQGLDLKASYFQLQQESVMAALERRMTSPQFGSTEVVSQGFNNRLQARYETRSEMSGLNQTANILMGNEISKAAFDRVASRSPRPGVKNSFELAQTSGSFHPKVGYLSDQSGEVRTAFLGSQNSTSALSKSNTLDDLLVLRSVGTDNPAYATTQRLLSQIKDATDSLLEITAAQHNNMVLKNGNTLNPDFREAFRQQFVSKGQYSNASSRALKINQEYIETLEQTLGQMASGQRQGNIVIASQYIESIFRPYNESGKFSEWRSSVLRSIETLATQTEGGLARIRIAGTAVSFNQEGGIYNLLDDLYAGKLGAQEGRVVRTLLDSNVFNVLPSRYLHSKGWAVFRRDAATLVLDEFALGSGNPTAMSFKQNLELGLVLRNLRDENQLSSIQNLEYLQGYMLYGMANGFRPDRYSRSGTLAMDRGVTQQVVRAMEMLRAMGGIQNRNFRTDQKATFGFAPRYNLAGNRAADTLMTGLNIQIRNPMGRGFYTLGVTIGQEYSRIKGDYVPILYLGKTNQVISGMIYKNDSAYQLRVLDRTIAPGETLQLNAIEVLGGLVATLQYGMQHEVYNRALLKTADVMLQPGRPAPSALNAIVTSSVLSAAQEFFNSTDSGLLNYRGRDLGGLVKTLVRAGVGKTDLAQIFGSAAQRLNLGPGGSDGRRLFETYGVEIQGGQIRSGARTLLHNLWEQTRASVQSNDLEYKTFLSRVIDLPESGLRDVYAAELRAGRRELFSQMTSIFQQPYALGYSHAQELYKYGVMGVDDHFLQSSGLAPQDGIVTLPGFILNPYRLKHGESLGEPGQYLRSIAATGRPESYDLQRAVGGLYKMEGGAPTVHLTQGVMGGMPGLTTVTKEEFRREAARLGLGQQERDRLEEELFALNNIRPSASSMLYLFPYAKAEQTSQRLKNWLSARPVVDVARGTVEYARSLGAFGSRDFSPEAMLSGMIAASMPREQYQYLQKIIEEESGNSARVLSRVRRERADLLRLSQGILGGSAPRLMMVNMGPTTMSDFSYYNASMNKALQYGHIHRVSGTFGMKEIRGSSLEFQRQMQQRLTAGTLFIGKDLEITGELREFLQREYNERLTVAGGDAASKMVLQQINQDYQGINARLVDGEFYSSFKRGVYRPGIQNTQDPGEYLRSVRKVGSLEDGDAAFRINDLYTYRDIGGGRFRKEAVMIKTPAISRREYNGISILTDELEFYDKGNNTFGYDANLMTVQDLVSGMRPGLQWNKGPWLGIEESYFNAVKRQTPLGLMTERVASQGIYAVVASGQIKGFPFESGYELLHGDNAPVQRLLETQGAGIKVAESLALLMLGEKGVAQTLGEHLVRTNRSQFGYGLLNLVSSLEDVSGLGTLGRKDLSQPKGQIKSTFAAYPAFMTLIPEQYRPLGIQEGLVQTVLEVLRGNRTLAVELQTRTKGLVDGILASNRLTLDNKTLTIQESWETRPAAILSFLLQTAETMLPDIRTADRIGQPGLSELSGLTKEAVLEIYRSKDKKLEGLYLGFRAQAQALRIKVPTREEFLIDSQRNKIQAEEDLMLATLNMQALLQTGRMLPLSAEMAPSKITTPVGNQDSTALEAQYAMALTEKSMGLFTGSQKERDDVVSMQQSLLVLASVVEGGVPGPDTVRSRYGLEKVNLAYVGVRRGDVGIGVDDLRDRILRRNEAFEARHIFSASYSAFNRKAIPGVYRSRNAQMTRSPGEIALDQYARTGSVYNAQGKLNESFVEMERFSQFVSGPVVPQGIDPQEELRYRASLFDPYVRRQFRESGSIRARAVLRTVLTRAETLQTQLLVGLHPESRDFLSSSKEDRWNRAVDLAAGEVQDFYLTAAERETYGELAKRLLVKEDYDLKDLGFLKQDIGSVMRKVYERGGRLNNNVRSRIKAGIQRQFEDEIVNTLMPDGTLGIYQQELESRIQASAAKDLGTQYIESLEAQREWALSRSKVKGFEQQAQVHLEAVERTQRLVLPALERLETTQDGKLKVFWASSDRMAPTQGLLLGLDILQKMSLVFQDISHEALRNQQKLSITLADSGHLLKRITRDMLNGTASQLSRAEFDQLQELRQTMRVATESAQSLANNEESIRKAMGDRMKMQGASYIAVSSLLVSPGEVMAGRRIETAMKLKTGGGLNSYIGSLRRLAIGTIQQGKEENINRFFETTAQTLGGFAQSLGLSPEKVKGLTAAHLRNVLVDQNTQRLVSGQEFRRGIIQTLTQEDVGSLEPKALKAAVETIEYQLFGFSMLRRQGGPGGSGQFDFEVNQILRPQDLQSRQDFVSTYLRPADETSNTLALVPAVGHQFMQLGDYDGDSFQVALSKLATVTKSISNTMVDLADTQKSLKKIRAAQRSLEKGNLSRIEANLSTARPAGLQGDMLASDYSTEAQHEKDLIEKLTVQQRDLMEKLEERNRLDRTVQDRAREGLARYTSDLTGLPQQVIERQFGSPEEQQGFVKQFRDTLAGLYTAGEYQNLAIAPEEISQIQTLGLRDGRLVATLGQSAPTDLTNRINRLLGQAQDSGVLDASLGFGGLRNQAQREKVLGQLVQYQSTLTSAQVGAGLMKKLLGGIQGPQMDGSALEGLQAVMGTTGTSMLGPTYNAVIPLLSLMQRDIAAERMVESEQYSEYRQVMAANLEELVKEKGQSLTEKKAKAFLNEQIRLLNSGDRPSNEIPLSIRVEQRKARTSAAYRMLVSVQQFLRDDALKPKAGAKGVWEAMENFTLTRQQRAEMGLQVTEGAETRGLQSILAEAPKQQHETIMKTFLGLQAGNALQYSYGVQPGETALETGHLMGFASLQLTNEFLSGRFSAEEMVLQGKSTLSGSLESIYEQQKKAAGGQLDVTNFMYQLTGDTLAKFSTEWIHSGLMETAERTEYLGDLKGIHDMYGIGKDAEGAESSIQVLSDDYRRQLEQRAPDAPKRVIDQMVLENRQNLMEQQFAIKGALQSEQESLGRSLTTKESFVATLRSLTEIKVRQDMRDLTPTLKEMRDFNIAMGQIQRNEPLVDLHQDLNLNLMALGAAVRSGKVNSANIEEHVNSSLRAIARAANAGLPDGVTADTSALAALTALGPNLMPDFGALGLGEDQTDAVRGIWMQAALRGRDGGLSPVEMVAQQSAGIAAYKSLMEEQQSLVAERRDAMKRQDQNYREEVDRIDRRLQSVEQSLVRGKEEGFQSLLGTEQVNRGFGEIGKMLAMDQARDNIYLQYERKRNRELVERSTTMRRAHNASEMVGLLAVPLAFGLMGGNISFGETTQRILFDVTQAALTTSTYENSVVASMAKGNPGSAVNISKDLHRAAQDMQAVRIRQFMRDSSNATESFARGFAFEAINQSSSIVASALTRKFLPERVGGGGGASRAITEIAGGVLGMGIAGLITNRPIPTTNLSVDDFVDRTLKSIRTSVREASERFMQALINQQESQVYDEDSGETLESSLQEGDLAVDLDNPGAAVGANDLNWYLGVTVVDQQDSAVGIR